VFNLFSPFSGVDLAHPVLQHMVSRSAWLKSPRGLHRFHVVMWLLVPLSIAGMWVVVELLVNDRARSPGFELQVSPDWLVVSLALNAIWMVINSLWTLTASLSFFHEQFHLHQWEILRLTGQPTDVTLNLLMATARVRSWPPLGIEVSLRLITFALYTILSLFSVVVPPVGTSQWPLFIVSVVLAVAFAALLVLESFLRHRLLIQLSMLVAVRIRHWGQAMLIGLGCIVLVHMIQAIAYGVIAYYPTTIPYSPDDQVRINAIGFWAMCLVPMALASLGLLYGLSFHWLRRQREGLVLATETV